MLIVAGTEPEFEPTSGQVIERRDFLAEEHGVTKVIVQDKSSEADPFSYRSQVREHRQRCPTVIDVIANEQDVETDLLGDASFPAKGAWILFLQLKPEAESPGRRVGHRSAISG
jgi:hypothetical protein